MLSELNLYTPALLVPVGTFGGYDEGRVHAISLVDAFLVGEALSDQPVHRDTTVGSTVLTSTTVKILRYNLHAWHFLAGSA